MKSNHSVRRVLKAIIPEIPAISLASKTRHRSRTRVPLGSDAAGNGGARRGLTNRPRTMAQMTIA
jgi:hypothetical protein